jgi:predicted ATP-grasp superfamily ATP-dependent carboligase
MMKRLGIEKVYTIGGVQDTISHSSTPQISIVGSSADAIKETMALQSGITAAEYQGPISIHTCIIRAAHENGITAVSLWGHVPAYLQKAPRLVAKLVSLISKVAGCECSTEPLIKQALELDRKIEEALARDPNLKQFVEALEIHENSELPSHDRDKIIRLNEFLRRDSQRDPKQ